MTRPSDGTLMRRAIAVGGGVVFIASLLFFVERYLRGFDAPVPAAGWALPVTIDVALFTLFAMHHSVFARAGVKAWLVRVVPPSLERSSYVWIASVLFFGVCAWWQPVPGALWRADGWLAVGLRLAQVGGAGLTLVAARHLDVLDLAGVRQGLALPARRASGLDDHGPYGLVRHPIYLAWLLLVWPAPLMNGTRLVFALVSTVYLVTAIPFEERDLRRQFGDEYDRYSARVPKRLLPGIY